MSKETQNKNKSDKTAPSKTNKEKKADKIVKRTEKLNAGKITT